MRLFFSAAMLAGCAYQSGSWSSELQTFRGQRASTDCVDISVDRRPDLPQGDVVLAYAFGNGCDHPATIDLATAVVVGGTRDGTVQLAAYDPGGELQSLELDGRAVGHETISYPRSTPTNDVCVDAASITHTLPMRWLCFPQLAEVP